MSKEMKDTKEVGKSRTKIHVGDIFDTNNCGKLVVLEYENASNLKVKFIDTAYETTTRANQLRKGEVRDRSLPSVYGVGIIGNGITRVCGVETRDHKLWNSMLCRCYDEKLHAYRPTYEKCSVSDNFKYLPYFEEWCHQQIGFDQDGWQLDKDILIKGNKIYSEDTCCFVPHEINSAITSTGVKENELPVGVSKRKDRDTYSATITKHGKVQHLGSFPTANEAFEVYITERNDYILQLANKWKGKISTETYFKLISNFSIFN